MLGRSFRQKNRHVLLRKTLTPTVTLTKRETQKVEEDIQKRQK